MAKPKGSPDKGEPDGDEGSGDKALDAMSAFIDAVKEGDAEGALMAYRDLCDAEGHDEPDGDEY